MMSTTRDGGDFVPLGEEGLGTEGDGFSGGQAAGGDVEEDLPPLRPRGIGEILDLAFEILRRRPLACFGFSAALWLPARLLRTWYNVEFGLAPPGDVAGLFAFALVAFILPIVIPLVIAAALARVAYDTVQGRGTLRASTFAVLRPLLFLRLMLLTFLVAMMTGLGTLACIVPGFYLAWRLSTATTSLVIEDLTPLEAIRRSFRITRGTFLRWLGLMVVQQILLSPFSGPVAIFDDPTLRRQALSGLALTPPAVEALSLFLSTLFLSVATAFSGLALAVFYLDCRVRTDGFDLDMALDRLRRKHADSHGRPALR
jgi:hypothetical protein